MLALFLTCVLAYEDNLLQAPLYAPDTDGKFAAIATTLTKKGAVMGPYDSSKPDPTHAMYIGGQPVVSPVELYDAQDSYTTITLPFYVAKEATTGADTSTKKSEYFAMWPKKGGTGPPREAYKKKFLTTGSIGYGWKFHELTEKKYTKEVSQDNGGNLTTLYDTTNASFTNKNDKVNVSAVTEKKTVEDAKVFKGKSATTLLQTKSPTTTKTLDTTDTGYNRSDYAESTKQEGTIGKGNSKESGTYTKQEGANVVSVLEMPKVTAKKSGEVDVEWRGGDSYTTAKMMNGMKKFIKRAARGEKW